MLFSYGPLGLRFLKGEDFGEVEEKMTLLWEMFYYPDSPKQELYPFVREFVDLYSKEVRKARDEEKR